MPPMAIVGQDANLVAKIREVFYCPQFFWSYTGQNSNGFFGGLEHRSGGPYKERFSACPARSIGMEIWF